MQLYSIFVVFIGTFCVFKQAVFAEYEREEFVLKNSIPVSKPKCEEAFDALENREKLYLHYISKASWLGGLICLFQVSLESPAIFLILDNHFRDNEKAYSTPEGVSEDDFNAFLVYAAGFYGSMGNYDGSSSSKIVPGCSQHVFETILKSNDKFAVVKHLYDQVKVKIFSLNQNELTMGMSANGFEGVSTYYSRNCVPEDAEKASRFMYNHSISAENTRLLKSKTSPNLYTILLASEEKQEQPAEQVAFEESYFRVVKGDYSELLRWVNFYLEKAVQYASNENEVEMLNNYIESFRTGSVEKHKEGSRYWIRNVEPIVETYIGFIETYRDPAGLRAEFLGFAAVVNKPMSAKFGQLVDKAEQFLSALPWPKEFETDKFLSPDFTSLDVIAFGTSVIPIGINIPNYEDVRAEGSKNVALENIIAATAIEENNDFLSQEDVRLMKKHSAIVNGIKVGLHELLGHGSGKLLNASDDLSNVINPLTGQPVTKYYKGKETYNTVFNTLGSSYEECRAESVSLYLCDNEDVLNTFGLVPGSDEANEVIYVLWLTLAQMGLSGLRYYDPVNNTWNQAHLQARFVILQVMVEAGENFVTVERVPNVDEKGDDLLLKLDRSKIKTVGKEAIGKLLQKLQIYKSTADVESGSEMYYYYATPSEDFLNYREVVVSRAQPLSMIVLPNTVIKKGGSEVILVEYEASHKGMIKSFIDRFNGHPELFKDIENMWREYGKVF